MSSRHALLSPEERVAARAIPEARQAAEAGFAAGERRAAAVIAAARRRLEREPLCRIDYVEVDDAETLKPVEIAGPNSVLLLAVFFGKTRLIDNMRLG